MMHKKILIIMSLMLAAAPVITAPSAQAQMLGYNTTSGPLVIIRFNQRHVQFEQALYNALSRALQAKPSVMFDIVSYTPMGASARGQQSAQQNLARVVNSMRQMGVPAERISVTHQPQSGIPTSEVHIFVR
jgi:hypothetical protein